MRSLTALLSALLALALAGPAAAGTFTVPFGGGVAMGAAGWSAKADAGALCGFEGSGTIFLNAGTLPAHSGCFYLFNAPADAQIIAVNTTLGYTKASAATALCVYSFAAVRGTRCAAAAAARRRTRSPRAAPTGSRWASTTRVRRRSRSPPRAPTTSSSRAAG